MIYSTLEIRRINNSKTATISPLGIKLTLVEIIPCQKVYFPLDWVAWAYQDNSRYEITWGNQALHLIQIAKEGWHEKYLFPSKRMLLNYSSSGSVTLNTTRTVKDYWRRLFLLRNMRLNIHPRKSFSSVSAGEKRWMQSFCHCGHFKDKLRKTRILSSLLQVP